MLLQPFKQLDHCVGVSGVTFTVDAEDRSTPVSPV